MKSVEPLGRDAARAAPRDRAGRAIASFASGSGFAVLSTLLGFWATPKIVGWLGVERYGLSRAVIDLFGYLTLIEFGLAGASRPVLSKEIASADPIRKAVGFAIVGKAYLRATLWKAAVAIPLAAVAPFLIRIGHVSRGEMATGAALLILGTLATPSAAAQALLGAEQRDYLSNFALGTQNIVITLFALFFASRHWGVPGQTAAQLLGALVMTGVLTFAVRRTILASLRVRPQADDHAHQLLRKLNLPTFMRTIVGRMAIMSDRIIVASLLGGSAVTGFQSTLRLSDAIFPHLAGIGNAAWPGMADIHARGDLDLFRKRLLEITTTICGLSVLFAAPVLVVNEAFVNLWMGHGLFGGWMLTLAACANLMLLALTNYWDWCFNSASSIQAIVPLTVVAGTVNVGISIVATLWVGPIGPALGTLVAMGLVVVPWEVYLLCEQFGLPWERVSLAVARPLALGAFYVVICRAVTRGILVERWDSIAITSCGTALGWAVIAWWTVFDPATRDAWRGRIVRLLGRFHV